MFVSVNIRLSGFTKSLNLYALNGIFNLKPKKLNENESPDCKPGTKGCIQLDLFTQKTSLGVKVDINVGFFGSRLNAMAVLCVSLPGTKGTGVCNQVATSYTPKAISDRVPKLKPKSSVKLLMVRSNNPGS